MRCACDWGGARNDPCAPGSPTLAGAALRWCKVYAVVSTGGKQYRVSEGAQLVVDRLAAEVGSTIEFADVLMIGGDSPKVGAPHVAGARVKATVVAHEQGEKTEYVRYLHRRRTRTQKNGRAKLTILQINGIEG
ncbi:MAG: 50S ribosomal protein L21 [Myxococcales bacterium]|nr:50S ribosomal protein L21 [Myxococcales bacterium]